MSKQTLMLQGFDCEDDVGHISAITSCFGKHELHMGLNLYRSWDL